MSVYVLIIAGGRGERFWPLSRFNFPKQFLSLDGGLTLLQQTLLRAKALTDLENIFVITGLAYTKIVTEQLPQLSVKNLILEPIGRDTAPCIGLGCLHVLHRNSEGIVVILPADHYIEDSNGFTKTLKIAINAALSGERLVTIGIPPTRPETGYGYIEVGPELDNNVFKVYRFIEKPDYNQALKFIKSGNYWWNSGMFIWKASTGLAAIQKHLPALGKGLKEISPLLNREDKGSEFADIFCNLPKFSIDFGVMEKAENIAVVPASFKWDDLGNWIAVERLHDHDDYGNTAVGNPVLVDTKNSLVHIAETGRKTKRLLVTFGVKDLVIVETDDVILVTTKEKSAELKKVLEILKENGFTDYI